MRPFRIAYALGGGGARGTAHLGVIQSLADAGIVPDLIVGTSAGAVAGAAYALLGDATEAAERVLASLSQPSLIDLEQHFRELAAPSGDGWRGQLRQTVTQARKLMLWNRQAVRPSIVNSEALHELARNVVGDAEFADTVIPFYAVAHDLVSNRDVIMSSGDLDVAVWASGAIPGVFRPVTVGEFDLVDGCALQVLPTPAAVSLGADAIVAVDISLDVPVGAPESAAEILRRVSDVRADVLRLQAHDLADVVISPDVRGVRWMEVSKGQQCYEAGLQAALERLPEVKTALRRARWMSLLRRWFGRNHRPLDLVDVRRADLA